MPVGSTTTGFWGERCKGAQKHASATPKDTGVMEEILEACWEKGELDGAG